MIEGNVSPLAFGNSVIYYGSSMGFPVGTSTQSEYDAAKATWNSYLPLVSELGPTVLRYPGGLLANSFGWKSGIGPVSQRDSSYDRAKGGGKQIFGTDEFLLYCEEIGAQAIITVNVSPPMSTRPGSVQDAADWVEYCNAPNDGSNPGGGTDWAAIRASNGHHAPYKVKYWELGNEELYPGKEDYARRVKEYSTAMKAIDPTIKIGIIRTGGGINPFFDEIPKFIEYQNFMTGNVSRYFDFWVHHIHPPGASGLINGFTMVQDSSVEAPVTIKENGPYKLNFPIEASCTSLNLNCPKLHLLIDGVQIQEITSSPGIAMITTAPFNITAGRHLVQVKGDNIGDRRTLTICHQLEIYELAGRTPAFAGLVDLKEDVKLYQMVVAGSVEPLKEIQLGAPYTGGKPVYFTETGIEYKEDRTPPLVSKVCDLREALGLASLYQMYLQNGIELINYWDLFDDNNANGILEGVAWNMETNTFGRADPHKRPSYHVLKAYRRNVFDQLVKAEAISLPTFTAGPQSSGIIFGFFSEEATVPNIQVLASKSRSGDRLSLFVLNLDPENSSNIPISILGFDSGPDVKVYTITGASPSANNEKGECPSGDCVSTLETHISIQGNRFVYTFGKHSLTTFVFYKNGSDQTPPAAPLDVAGSAGDGKTLIAWTASSDRDIAGYRVYRSRVSTGPFGNRVNSQLVRDPQYTDLDVDNGVTYYYAITAVDQAGNESPFSRKICLKPRLGAGNPVVPSNPEGPDTLPPSAPILIEIR